MIKNILGSVGAVVHKEELDILGVVHNESLVAGRHHVAGLLVATVADLSKSLSAMIFLIAFSLSPGWIDIPRAWGCCS